MGLLKATEWLSLEAGWPSGWRVSSAVDDLWWALMWDTKICMFCAHSCSSIPMPFTQTYLSPKVQFFSFHAPDQLAKSFATYQELVYIWTSVHLFLHTKGMTKYTVPWEDLPLSSRDTPNWGCNRVVHFQMVPKYLTDLLVKWFQLLFSFY